MVSIIIVNWNGREVLRRCLNSIRENTTYPNYKIVVVDNGSTDGSVTMIKKEFPYVKLIQNKENLGYAKANNQGIKSVESDYYLLLNNDTEVTKGWLTDMIEFSESDPKIGITGCKLIYPNGRSQTSDGPVQFRGGYAISGAVMLIKKKVVDKIGLLDEGFSPFLYEDKDYCVRAREAGYKIVQNPNVTIIHYGGYTTRKHNLVQAFFTGEKNRIRFMLLNYPLRSIVSGAIPYEIKRLGAIFAGRYGEYGKTILSFPLLGKAWLINLKSLKEILQKRRCRTMKI
jgi:hypothetical protein